MTARLVRQRFKTRGDSSTDKSPRLMVNKSTWLKEPLPAHPALSLTPGRNNSVQSWNVRLTAPLSALSGMSSV